MDPRGLAALTFAVAIALTATIASVSSLPARRGVESTALPLASTVDDGGEWLLHSEIVAIDDAPPNVSVRHDYVTGGDSSSEYVVYEFAGDGTVFIARTFPDYPGEAYLLGKTTPGHELLESADFTTKTLRDAIAWLHSRGARITWISRNSPLGYEAISEFE